MIVPILPPRCRHFARQRGGLLLPGDSDADAEQACCRRSSRPRSTLFEAEASSIALFERDPDRLEFRVAAGAQGQGAIGLSVPPSRGIVGFVFSTGQPLALSDVLSDPRFDRATAERTGYVPRSIAAVPLIDGEQTVGVLQVLDKRSSADVLAPRHGAARGLRAPGRGRHPRRSRPARHQRCCCARCWRSVDDEHQRRAAR